MKTQWTPVEIIAFRPCYAPEKVYSLFASAPSLTLREMLALDIPLSDKQWLVFRPDMLTLKQIDRLFVLFKKQGAYADAYARADAYAYADAYARADAYAYARAYADADDYARARADAYARVYADAYAYAYADADARVYADDYARARADADARVYADDYADAYARVYADARAGALQAQIDDVLAILSEDGL